MRNFKKILLILIISLISTYACFSKTIYENNACNLLIEYNDVKLFGSNRYTPIKILDENDNAIFIFNERYGNLVKTNEYTILFDNTYIIYFYGVSFDDVWNWYFYSDCGLFPKPLITCKKMIVEIRR